MKLFFCLVCKVVCHATMHEVKTKECVFDCEARKANCHQYNIYESGVSFYHTECLHFVLKKLKTLENFKITSIVNIPVIQTLRWPTRVKEIYDLLTDICYLQIYVIYSRDMSLQQRYRSLQQRYVSLQQRYMSLQQRYVSLQQRYMSLQQRYMSLQQRYELTAEIYKFTAEIYEFTVEI